MVRGEYERLRSDADRIRARLEDAAVTGVERHELQDGLTRIEKRLERMEDRLLSLEASVNQMRGAALLAKVAIGLVGFNTIVAFLAFVGSAAK